MFCPSIIFKSRIEIIFLNFLLTGLYSYSDSSSFTFPSDAPYLSQNLWIIHANAVWDQKI